MQHATMATHARSTSNTVEPVPVPRLMMSDFCSFCRYNSAAKCPSAIKGRHPVGTLPLLHSPALPCACKVAWVHIISNSGPITCLVILAKERQETSSALK